MCCYYKNVEDDERMEEDEEKEKACIKFEDNVSCCFVSLLVAYTGIERERHAF